MNILMVGPDLHYGGGVPTIIKNYMQSALAKKIKFFYLSTAIRGNMPAKLLYAARAYILLSYMLLFKKIDLVHVHMASRGSFHRKKVIIDLCRFFGKKVIVHIHSGEFHVFYEKESSEKQKGIITKTLDKADTVIVLSKKWKEIISKITRTNIIVLHNAVQVKHWNIYDPDSKNILFMGNLWEKKGVYDILSIISVVIGAFSQVRFVLTGSGEIDRIREVVRRNKLEEYVELPGWVEGEGKEKLLSESFLFILPSYYEGMPMSILEAMSCGIPVIATNVGGIPQIIENNKNGILIEPGDRTALCEQIIRLAGDRTLRERISRNAYDTVKTEFDLEKNVDCLYRIYVKVANTS